MWECGRNNNSLGREKIGILRGKKGEFIIDARFKNNGNGVEWGFRLYMDR